ncbi:MAG: phenylalanine--tRNA ligase subunit alpha [Chloroflexi bacterium]|nr:MAG: phenylalanine--tRNA ligase subunit alpha [Chloroflexota bacterium]RLC96644.1 MAG: phenylalanine--tRNA ligase subunit alpha [Chloroflexota bacterium]
MLAELEQLKARAFSELDVIDNLKHLEEWRLRYLGRKGSLTLVLRGLSGLPLEERRVVGAAANEIKAALEAGLKQKQDSLKEQSLAVALQKSRIDVTLPGYPVNVGRFHPTTQTIREVCAVFASMGFQVIEGPEVEWDYYNFEALNIPRDHPARDMWATLWVEAPEGENPMLLRTHTSPMQIRLMEKTRPPVRAVIPGKTYRYEATDATHESMFYQIEGLAVDRGITMGDLKGTLFEFARRVFGEERRARFRCDYFPFVEPGVEMAIDCWVCRGKGCRLCGNTGWIEILGAGMVHPQVLRRVDYDPDVYSGFAFGVGVERIPMLRYGIEDIRLFYGNDLRFLKQF